ncbi:MAG: 16S rRNA (cytidine(1402)-2'-O)-methyltransferase [Desulfovibrio sp.]|nr:16S rRNA (cytidine(1402)-2'-O)-methyltransferase [Desulfovibrio sp.]
MPLTSPRLWIVATPLGNLGDLSPRAREVLAGADLVLAEDTRRAAQLCRQCGIEVRRFLSFFDHNEKERQTEVLRLLQGGKDIALISDAGTPLLADPGYRLVRACRKQGLPVSPVPGPSAPVTALSAAGLPPLPYTFLGFLPRDAGGRRNIFAAFSSVPGTLVFFERKDRLAESLAVAHELLGPRELAVCRELTKIHEEFILGRLEDAASLPNDLLGELTVLIGPPETVSRSPESFVHEFLRKALSRGAKPREAAREVQAKVRGWSGKEIYAAIEAVRNAAECDTSKTEE